MAHLDDTETQRANTIYIRRAMKAPLLERAHELDLARRWRETGDQTALAELVGAYGRMVVSVALKFRHYGLPVGDLIQEGNIGLLQAAQRFEPSRDVRFATYAQWWVRAAIQDFVLRNLTAFPNVASVKTTLVLRRAKLEPGVPIDSRAGG